MKAVWVQSEKGCLRHKRSLARARRLLFDPSVNKLNCGINHNRSKMLVVAKDLQTQYEKALDSASIGRELRLCLESLLF